MSFKKGDLVMPYIAIDQDRYVGIIEEVTDDPHLPLIVRWLAHPYESHVGTKETNTSQNLVPFRFDDRRPPR